MNRRNTDLPAPWKTRIAMVLPVVAILLMVVVLGVFLSRQNTACSQVEDVRTALRTILTNAKVVSLKSPQLSPAQRAGAVRFYDTQLLLVEPHHC